MNKFKMMIATTVAALIAVVIPFSAFAAASTTTVSTLQAKMKFDGQELALPAGQTAFTYEQRVYIPLRFVAYALQKSVVWDAKTSTVRVSEPTPSEVVVLKEYLMNAAAAAKSGSSPAASAATVKVTFTNAKFVFDGKEKPLPAGQKVFAKDGTIYVPARFMSESVGTVINWDAKTKIVSGESKAYREAQQGSSGGSGSGGSGSSGGTGSTGGNGNSGGSSGGGASGGNTGKQTQAEIEAEAYAQLENLRDSCINTIVGIGMQYVLESDPDKQAALKAEAEAELASCTAKFESIVSDTEAKLKANGYSTDVIQSYRDEFEAELKAWREKAEAVL